MELEKQVCSLELAKRLKELGVKQESLFYWHYINEYCFSVRYMSARVDCAATWLYSAFTVAELGEILKLWQKSSLHLFNIEMHARSHDEYDYWSITLILLYPLPMKIKKKIFCEDTEADVRAKLIIYLYKHGLLK